MISDLHQPDSELARLLVTAQKTRTPLSQLRPDLVPTNADVAYAVQHQTLVLLRQGIGGWKVGAKSLAGPIQGAPLPADRVLHGEAATVRRQDYAVLGLELEIAFRFGRVFAPSTQPYSDESVLNGVESMLATIEVVSSRLARWPEVDKLSQLADLQNHGALACGEPVPFSASFAFEAPQLTFTFDRVDIVKGQVGNPAGDPRRLLIWVVNHCAERGIAIGGDIVVTTGSYTGIHFPDGPGMAVGQIHGLAPARLTIV